MLLTLSGQKWDAAGGVEGGVCVYPALREECVCGAAQDALAQGGGLGGGEGPYREREEGRRGGEMREEGERRGERRLGRQGRDIYGREGNEG